MPLEVLDGPTAEKRLNDFVSNSVSYRMKLPLPRGRKNANTFAKAPSRRPDLAQNVEPWERERQRVGGRSHCVTLHPIERNTVTQPLLLSYPRLDTAGSQVAWKSGTQLERCRPCAFLKKKSSTDSDSRKLLRASASRQRSLWEPPATNRPMMARDSRSSRPQLPEAGRSSGNSDSPVTSDSAAAARWLLADVGSTRDSCCFAPAYRGQVVAHGLLASRANRTP